MLNIESKDILSFDLHGLEKLMVSFGYKAFHGQQVYAWIYRRGITDYDKMTDLQKDLRKKLFDNYPEMLPKIIKEVRGSGDQSTTKFLLEAEDKQRFEVVNIPTQDRNTLCVSCQVGCVYNCKFCATGSMGFKRNLTYEEIVGSYFAVQNRIKERITNIVFMGMGEPLINLKNVMQAWNIFTEPDGIGISRRKVTISTVGIPDQIRVLALEPYPPKLVFSICSPHEEIRRKLLLKAGKYSLEEIHKSLMYYSKKSRNRITIALLIAKGFNNTIEDAKALHSWIRNLPVKINILRYNETEDGLSRADENDVEKVANELHRLGRTVILRQSRGSDINAACGQLAAKY